MNVREHEVSISIDPKIVVSGTMCIPASPIGIVIMAHGSSRARKLERERLVAAVHQRAGFATLLLDLLTPQEEVSEQVARRLRFDLPLLTGRLILTTSWLCRQPETHELPIGLLGANAAGAAALVTAAHESDRIRAIVVRGGRPDLLGEDLSEVHTPTLLIVGGADVPILAATRAALPRLTCETEIEVVPGATHLFEQPGALELAAFRARDWFRCHLEEELTVVAAAPTSRRASSRVATLRR